jgi:hypothetical protein
MSPSVGSPQLSGELSSAASPPPQPVTLNGPTAQAFGLPVDVAVALGGGGVVPAVLAHEECGAVGAAQVAERDVLHVGDCIRPR